MNVVFVAALLLPLLSGCAQNLKSHSVPTEPTIINLDVCHLSVKFSGRPDLMPQAMVSPLSNEMYARNGADRSFWRYIAAQLSNEIDVRGATQWMYLTEMAGVRKLETASCACPPKEWLNHLKMSAINNRRYIEGVGMVSETTIENLEDGTKMSAQAAIDSESNCVVVQSLSLKGSPESFGDSASQFFSSLIPIVKPVQNSSDTGIKAPASERLRQLDSLLKEKLISDDEFQKRRAIVLETL